MIDYNTVDDINSFEAGEMDPEQIRVFFRGIAESGLLWELQGAYQRRYADLMAAGELYK